MSLRKEFIMLASQDCANISELCRRFGISRKTAYKWLGRYGKAGDEGLQDRSRRPHRSSNRIPEPMEQLALSMRTLLGVGARSSDDWKTWDTRRCQAQAR
jgi:transposase-like protein